MHKEAHFVRGIRRSRLTDFVVVIFFSSLLMAALRGGHSGHGHFDVCEAGTPSMLAVGAALASILTKEVLYQVSKKRFISITLLKAGWRKENMSTEGFLPRILILLPFLSPQITASVGVKYKSQVVIANAWHHRSDAISSIMALGGIMAARMGLTAIDPLAGILVTTTIGFTGIQVS